MDETHSNRPNIMLLIGEDTGRLLGCYGHPTARTPNLDALAGQGCRYDQAYTTYPVCAPSRSTIVTGQYPMKIGTHPMRSKLLSPPRLFTHELREAGYWVNWHTKLDFNFDPPEGWRDTDEPWVDALRENRLPDRPWLVYENFGQSHESQIWPANEQQPPRGPLKTDPAAVPVPAYLPDTPVVRRDIAQHDDNTAEVDRLVGQRLEALEASGLAQNTVVIFIVDHGRGLPREKRWPYPAGLHMPLIIRWPGKIGPGTVEHRLVSWVDLAPTILRIAGVEVPKHYDGLAFLGPGGVSVQPEREHAFGGRDRMDEALDRQRVCTDGRYWYVRNFFPQLPYAQRVRYMENGPTTQELRRLHAAGELHGSAEVFMQPTKPAEEFYDLAGDPDAVSNLVDDPAHEGTLQRLRLAMDDWLEGDWDLGAVPERELIQRGLQEDQLDQYRSRIEPLPPAQQIGPELTVLEPHEVPDRPSGT